MSLTIHELLPNPDLSHFCRLRHQPDSELDAAGDGRTFLARPSQGLRISVGGPLMHKAEASPTPLLPLQLAPVPIPATLPAVGGLRW